MNTQEKKNLRVGIIGCGNMAKVHVRLLKKLVSEENLAVCDLDRLRLEQFVKQWGVKHAYTDLDAMLKEFQPDIVHVVTPPVTHQSLAVRCLDQGCHALIEKPMCLTSAEAGEIVRAAERNKKKVAVDHMRSYEPLTLRAKALLDSGRLGRIVNISCAYSYDYLKRIDFDPAARWINNLPGGSFFDLIPHLICMLDDFMPDLKLDSRVVRKNKDGVVTDVSCQFVSPEIWATLHMSLNIYPLKNYLELECENGTIRCDFRNFLLITRKNFGLPNAVERIVENIHIGFQYLGGSFMNVFNFLRGRLDPYAGLEAIMRRLQQAVREDGPSPEPPQRAKRLLELTEAVFHEEESSQPAPPPRMEGAEILVTGGTGFIGRQLVNRLIAQGKKVRVFARRQLDEEDLKSYYAGPVDYVRGNIYHAQEVRQACEGMQTVYHVAAAMKGGDWNYHMDTTITGTRNVLNSVEDAGVKQLIYVSTLSVYDAKSYPEGKEIDETFADEEYPEKRGAYSHAKLIAEQEVREFMKTSRVPVAVFRPGRVYGPGEIFFQDVGIRKGGLLFVMGMGSRRMPLIYVDNLIDALTAAGEHMDKVKGGTFHAVDDDYPSQRQYLKRYRELTGTRLTVIYLPLSLLSAGFWVLQKLLKLFMKKEVSICYKLKGIAKSPRFSTARLRSALGWSPKVNFEEGLKRICAASDS